MPSIAPSTPTTQSLLGTLRLTLDAPSLGGDRVAAIAEWVRDLTNGTVVLASLSQAPARIELRGPIGALQDLSRVLRPETLGTPVTRAQLNTEVSVDAGGPSRVLVVDGNEGRAREDAEVLGRADIDVCIATRARTAAILLRDTAVPFDAVVLRHRLRDGDGLALLDQIGSEAPRCSVTVLDDHIDPARARAYRVAGAFRYLTQPRSPLQLIGCVHATVLDGRAWRQTGDPWAAQADAPPRLFLDPGHAADRLQYVHGLSGVEREVAHCVLLGLRDLDIAKRLRKSERTAKRHVGRVLEKAGIPNRASLWATLYHEARSPMLETNVEAANAPLPRAVKAPHQSDAVFRTIGTSWPEPAE